MKIIQMPKLQRINQTFQDLQLENINLYFESFTCKYTKDQKKIYRQKNYFSHLKNAIVFLFPEISTSDLFDSDFEEMNFQEMMKNVEREAKFIDQHIQSKNEIVKTLLAILRKEVGNRQYRYFLFTSRIGPFEHTACHFCYLFYSKKRKRIIILFGEHNEL